MSDTETEVILRHEGMQLAHVSLAPGEYIIGRKADAHISIDLPKIAREHARLIIGEDRAVYVEDLGTLDGTFVGEEPAIVATRVLPNQPVTLGDVVLEVRGVSQLAPPPPSPEPVTLPNPAAQALLGAKRYQVGDTVAVGGMGAILQARETATQRTVAMKVMLRASSERSVMRFIAEAQVNAQLEHPNIVPVHDLGVDEQGQVYYTMKLVRGITLKKVLELMADGVAATIAKYPLSVLLTIFQKVCDAIAFAHSRGVLHRDLKPENVMLDDFGVVLVMDWGLSKVIGAEEAGDRQLRAALVSSSRDLAPEDEASGSGSAFQTIAGTVLGTPKFMSPEQARGEIQTLDERSDVYALGAILFQILYLRPPVAGESSDEVLRKVQCGDIDWPGETRLGAHLPGRRVPPSLVAVCRKALALDRQARYRTVSELQDDLAAYQAGFATTAENAGTWTQLRLLVARHKPISIAAAVIFALSGFFAVNLVRERNHAAHEAARASRALADLRRTAPALRQLADGDARVLRFQPALDELDAAIALDPGRPADQWRRAFLLIGLERFADAAATLRETAQRDPANAKRARSAPLLERMAAARTDAERFATELLWPLYQDAFEQGLTGEALALSRHLHLQADDRLALVRKQLAERYPPEAVSVSKTPIGRITVIFSNRVADLEGMRLVPCDVLIAENLGLTNLEPLRDLRLVDLLLYGNPITSLEPLRKLPLDTLHISAASLADLEPLRGLPLRRLRLEQCHPGLDLTPLLDCKQLDTLVITGSPKNLDVLRKHPALERISDRFVADFGGSFGALPPAAEFWLLRDAQKNR